MDAQIGYMKINGLDEDAMFQFIILRSCQYLTIKQAEELILFLQKEISNHEIKN